MTIRRNQPNTKAARKRMMSAILERTGRAKVDLHGDRPIRAMQLLAARIWEAVTEGKTTVGEQIYTFDSEEWFELVKFLYAQVDGAPKGQLEVSGDQANPLTLMVTTPENREQAAREIGEWRAKQIEQLKSANQLKPPSAE